MTTFKKIGHWFNLNFKLSKSEFKKYFLFVIPIIVSSILFSANGFIDNFMVTHIDKAVSALSYANAWLGIIMSLFIGINIVGNMLYGQYKGRGDIYQIRSSNIARYSLSLFIAFIIFVAAQIFPGQFIAFFSRQNSGVAYELGIRYIRIVSWSWIMYTFIFVTANILRELGVAKYVLYINIFSISSNVFFNVIFLNVLKMNVEGAAYATLISCGFYIVTSLYFFIKHKREYLVIPILFWRVHKPIWMHYLKRSPTIFISSFSIMFVTLRTLFWNEGFPEGTIGNSQWALGAAIVLGITQSITNILTSALPSVSSAVSNFVGKELGAGNLAQAKIETQKLRGFNFMLNVGLSSLFALCVIGFAYVSYFSSGVENSVYELEIAKQTSVVEARALAKEAGEFYLKQIQLTLIPIILYNPFWIWIVTTTRSIGSGGRTNITSIFDFSFNILHILFLVLLIFGIKPLLEPKVGSYAILPILNFMFFSFEILIKMPFYEILFYKMKWAKTI